MPAFRPRPCRLLQQRFAVLGVHLELIVHLFLLIRVLQVEKHVALPFAVGGRNLVVVKVLGQPQVASTLPFRLAPHFLLCRLLLCALEPSLEPHDLVAGPLRKLLWGPVGLEGELAVEVEASERGAVSREEEDGGKVHQPVVVLQFERVAVCVHLDGQHLDRVVVEQCSRLLVHRHEPATRQHPLVVEDDHRVLVEPRDLL
mmetsp:Transcript_20751/g.44980  ORF Transcript_20751/g.44980 Transcript_20751/m.44980 type:complete len:201 (-) Transcript_20751:261-863(-)